MLKNWKKTGQGRAGGPFLGILLLLFIGVGCAAGNSSKEAREAAEAPAWEVEGEDHGILIPVDTVEQFDEKVLKAQNPVVVDFFSPSCGACMLLAPKLERVASEYSGKAGFVKVDVGRAKALVTQYARPDPGGRVSLCGRGPPAAPGNPPGGPGGHQRG